MGGGGQRGGERGAKRSADSGGYHSWAGLSAAPGPKQEKYLIDCVWIQAKAYFPPEPSSSSPSEPNMASEYLRPLDARSTLSRISAFLAYIDEGIQAGGKYVHFNWRAADVFRN